MGVCEVPPFKKKKKEKNTVLKLLLSSVSDMAHKVFIRKIFRIRHYKLVLVVLAVWEAEVEGMLKPTV
jgi:hypothetical protein